MFTSKHNIKSTYVLGSPSAIRAPLARGVPGPVSTGIQLVYKCYSVHRAVVSMLCLISAHILTSTVCFSHNSNTAASCQTSQHSPTGLVESCLEGPSRPSGANTIRFCCVQCFKGCCAVKWWLFRLNSSNLMTRQSYSGRHAICSKL